MQLLTVHNMQLHHVQVLQKGQLDFLTAIAQVANAASPDLR